MPCRTFCQRLRNSSADQAFGIDAGLTAFFIAAEPGFAPACEVWPHSGSELPATATATVEDAPKSKSLRERLLYVPNLEDAGFIVPSSKIAGWPIQLAARSKVRKESNGNVHQGQGGTQKQNSPRAKRFRGSWHQTLLCRLVDWRIESSVIQGTFPSISGIFWN